jgi:hypothetical protein
MALVVLKGLRYDTSMVLVVNSLSCGLEPAIECLETGPNDKDFRHNYGRDMV